jgi:hypothetical protein
MGRAGTPLQGPCMRTANGLVEREGGPYNRASQEQDYAAEPARER